MAPRRRPRGSLIDPVSTGYEIERMTKERFDALAERAGISSSAFFEQVVAHIELTDQGLPTWWTPLPRDEELPIRDT